MDEGLSSQLLGPLGGAIAVGIGTGFLLAWKAFSSVVKPYEKAVQDARLETMQVRINLLEQQVKELEEFKQRYFELLLRHAKPTLEIDEEHHQRAQA